MELSDDDRDGLFNEALARLQRLSGRRVIIISMPPDVDPVHVYSELSIDALGDIFDVLAQTTPNDMRASLN